jgi:hypothetical protein
MFSWFSLLYQHRVGGMPNKLGRLFYKPILLNWYVKILEILLFLSLCPS